MCHNFKKVTPNRQHSMILIPRIIILSNPEKGGHSRIWKITTKLMNMLKRFAEKKI
jgi:hypothetical protein